MMRRTFAGVATILTAFLALTIAPRHVRADGLIVIQNSPVIVPGHFRFAPLEVTYHKVDCAIHDQAAVTTVDQEFYNPNNVRLEGEYIFPVPKDAQINKFSMDIDGKAVDAELLPADKARKIYEDIVRASRDPALLEYAGRAMFKVRIFPIDPNSKKHITLKYTEFLKQDNGLLDYHYTLNTEKYSSKPLQNVSIKVTIDSAVPITTLYSPTHEVEIIRPRDGGANHATVGYEAQNVRPDTDFHLFIGRKQSPLGMSVLTYRPDPTKDGYFVLMAAPTVNPSAKPMPKDVVFVVDTSGSMSGEKIEQARKALKYCIETLNPEDRFEIVRFSTESEPFFGTLKGATDDNRKKALAFAADFRAAGGTAIDEALQKALADFPARIAGENRLSMLVFMTDGQPTVGEQDPDAILAHVKKAAGDANIRIFSFGVGTDVNTKLLDLVAEQTRGYSQYVLPDENLELAMSNFWSKVQDPILANLKLTLPDVRPEKMYPKELPDLFKGDQLVVFGTYSTAANGAITITGSADGKQQKFAQDVSFQDKTDSSHEWIAKLWATRRIGYLLDEIRLHGENKELKDEIVQLARRWGIVTPYTAMLIIEDEKHRNVPVALQSLREMETDHAASRASGNSFDSLKDQEATGGRAVSNSIAQNVARTADNLDQAKEMSEQKQTRMRAAPTEKAALDNSKSPIAAASPGAGHGGDVGGQVFQKLNLGTNDITGWQNGNAAIKDAATGKIEKPTGYRAVTNYAQQTRLINNRAFFLNGNQWTDSRAENSKDKTIQITFGSDDYFALLNAHPEAVPIFARLYIVMDSGQRYEIQSPWQISIGKTLLNYFYVDSDREAKLRKAAISSLEIAETSKNEKP